MNAEQNVAEQEEKEEILHFMKVLNAFKAYRNTALRALSECEDHYEALPEHHKKIIPKHHGILQEMKVCIDFNAAVIKEITSFCSGIFLNRKYNEIAEHVPHTSMDADKVKSTLKQIVRDWCAEGAEERRMCYEPIINEITARMPANENASESGGSSSKRRVLVPGCGLGRLPWELTRRGYDCQGNEFSFFMLFTSHFIINRIRGDSEQDYHQYTFYPWVGKRCNNLSWDDVLKPVKFPDVYPGSLPPDSAFSMAAGDFMEVYTEEGSWDCVACSFFIDTASNVISFIERIYLILKPGGLFVNLGPLLYHFYGMSTESSIELSHEEVLGVIRQVGFKILKEDLVKALYTNPPRSMLNYEYICALIVAVKPDEDATKQ